MQRVELCANWIAWGQNVDFARSYAEDVHARDDCELRDCGEREHEYDENVADGKHAGSAEDKLVVDQRADEKDDTADEANPVELD